MGKILWYTLNSVVSHLCNQSARDILEFSSVNMDAWYYRNSVACDVMESHIGDMRTLQIRSPITYNSMVHSTWPSGAMWQTHAPTFNKWHKKKTKKNMNKKVTLHMLTHGAMRVDIT